MDLSPEDDLRLNVLLANDIQAIRIDESSRTLYALTPQGESKLPLHPTGRPEAYLRAVRETLSGHALGSPGGYPIFLRQWTRMGQITASNLEGLLLLGEPEAVIAVVRSPKLNEELARRAWWALPCSENARRMLARPCVAQSSLALELAAFLVEFLPFEENPADAVDSVRLILQPGLIDAPTRGKIWRMGARKNTLRVGFLAGPPEALPKSAPARPLDGDRHRLETLSKTGNPWADILLESFSKSGQTWIKTAVEVLKKPATQEVVWKLLEAVGNHFSIENRPPNTADDARPEDGLKFEHLRETANRQLQNPEEPLLELLNALPDDRRTIEALLILAQVQGELVTPIFARSSAVGSVMRKQIEPVVTPILAQLHTLYGNR